MVWKHSDLYIFMFYVLCFMFDYYVSLDFHVFLTSGRCDADRLGLHASRPQSANVEARCQMVLRAIGHC